ncbi:MAG TPA: hypothetical protein VH989_07290 [Actinomycetota bacterium]
MRNRRTAVLVIAGAAAVALGSVAVEAGSRGRPSIAFGETVPGDLEALVRTTWDRFTDAVPARWSCVAPVTIDGSWTLDDRASYDPDRRLVTVRIPGTAPNLEAALVHEFAHHLDFTCAARADLRSAFLAAQGLPRDTPWFDGATWERTPSEQFAEAMIEVVLGRSPPPPRILVSPDALDVVRAWCRGS